MVPIELRDERPFGEDLLNDTPPCSWGKMHFAYDNYRGEGVPIYWVEQAARIELLVTQDGYYVVTASLRAYGGWEEGEHIAGPIEDRHEALCTLIAFARLERSEDGET